MPRRYALAALALAALVAGCSSPPPPTVLPPGTAGDPVAAVGSPSVDVSGYRLGPGDQVRVTVFRHEDLSGEFQLDGNGDFSLPLVGEIQAGGRTVRALEQEIETALKDGGYLVNPQVGLEVLNYRPFYIIGEVNNPGSYPYVNGMTVINAVALAGGYTYRASQSSITLKRGGSNAAEVSVDPSAAVLPGDIISVPERFF